MTDSTIVERGNESGDYTIFDAATVAGMQAIKGFAFLTAAAEKLGDYAAVQLSDDGDDLELEKVTSATGRYSTNGPAVRHIYIDQEVLESLGGEGERGEDFEAPETLGISISPASEEDFEESQETPEEATEEAESLLDGMDDDAVEVQDDESDESDETDADDLLEDLDEAA